MKTVLIFWTHALVVLQRTIHAASAISASTRPSSLAVIPADGRAVRVLVTRRSTTLLLRQVLDPLKQALRDPSQEEILDFPRRVLNSPSQGGLLLMSTSQRPVGGTPLPQPDTGGHIKPSSDWCILVPRSDVHAPRLAP